MKFSILNRLLLLLVTIELVGCGGSGGSSDNTTTAAPDAEAIYQLTFQANWDNVEFPTNYPGNAHFSGLIGATHNDQKTFWAPSQLATAGVQSVAETGSKSSFTNEINDAITAGIAEYLISGGGVSNGTGSVSIEFGVNSSHPLVSIISMVAPSPDWIVGVHDSNLYDDTLNEWKSQLTVELKVYDAGTDSGVSFSSSNAATNPKETIQLLSSQPADTDFEEGVQRASLQTIGVFTFTRQN